LNFLLSSEKVTIELSKPFLAIKEKQELPYVEAATIELAKESDVIISTDEFRQKFPTWWRCPELNRGACKQTLKIF